MKYFKIEKMIEDQTIEELYNSQLIISKYEEIIFEQYPLFGKYNNVNNRILEILNNKKNIK